MPHRLVTTHRTSGATADSAQSFTLVNALKLDAKAELDALAKGLLAPAASLSPKYFYDALGSTLYNAIVLTDEYYPTRTEAAIFDTFRADIAAAIGVGKQFVDLGSGDSVKAEKWFASLKPSRYVGVDISESALTDALNRLAGIPDAPELVGLVTDFSRVVDLTAVVEKRPSVFFYPGSSIGNFSPDDAVWFLKQIRAHCHDSDCGLLIGVDAKKDKARLDAAYDDALGVTAAFNLNALRNVNRLLGSDFDVADWQHRGFYNEAMGRIEMHLEAKRAVQVRVRGELRAFAAGERIHTENSYKYSPEQFEAILIEAGFQRPQLWRDEKHDFNVFYANS
ncbi:MAG: L-histidine N(alpha)-methyltransferase [Betaproteobacteria bacterium]|nr:MAG: L-histidine N(alpha)-methyltransferase [Betaproteobacteria bacterium]